MDDMIAMLEKRAKAYQELLREKGHRPLDPCWDDKTLNVHLKYGGIPLLFMLHLDDPEFVRIMLPNFRKVVPEQLGAALLTVDMVNRSAKGARVFLNKERTEISASVDLLDGGDGIKAELLERYLGMVTDAAITYIKAFKKQVADSSA